MLSPVVPDAIGSGLEKRCAIFLDALERVGEVDLAVLPLSQPDAAARARLQGRSRVTLLPELGAQPHDTRFALMSRLRNREDWLAAFAEFGRPSLAAMASAAMTEALARHLEGRRYDLVHVTRSYIALLALDLLRRLGPIAPRLSLDLDEDDAAAFAMQARMAIPGSFEARRAGLEAVAFGRLIPDVAVRFDQIWASSQMECDGLRHRYRIVAEPVCNAVAQGPIRRRQPTRRLLFVGSMQHPFNVDAAQVLIDRIWPRLRGYGLRLDIIGKSPPPDLARRAARAGVQVRGWVPDLDRPYRTATALLAPLRFGAGTRFKLVEAAVHGVPIVATPVAAEGLGLRDGRDLWLAQGEDGIARATLDLLAHPQEAERRARNARNLVARTLDRSRIVTDLARRFGRMLDSGFHSPRIA